MKKVILFLFIVTSVTSLSKDWEYLGQPYGGQIENIQINDQGHLFVSSQNQIFRSTDKGQNWKSILHFCQIYENVGFSSEVTTYEICKFLLKNNRVYYLRRESDVIKFNSIKEDGSDLIEEFEWEITEWYDILGLEIEEINDSSSLICVDFFCNCPWGECSNYIEGYYYTELSIINFANGKASTEWNRKLYDKSKFDIIMVAENQIKLLGKETDYNNDGWRVGDKDILMSLILDSIQLSEISLEDHSDLHLLKKSFHQTNNELFSRNDDSIFKSIDIGKTWEFDFTIEGLQSIYVENDSSFLITTKSGLFKSTEPDGELKKLSDIEISIQATGTDSILVGESPDGSMLTTNYGKEWIKVNEFFSPANIGRIISDHRGNLYATSGSKLFKSTDMGNTWEVISDKYTSMLERTGDGTIISGNRRELMISKDGGKSWEVLFSDATMDCFIESIDINSNDEIVLLVDNGALDSSYVQLTTNLGETWEIIGHNIFFVESVGIKDDGTIFINDCYNPKSPIHRYNKVTKSWVDCTDQINGFCFSNWFPAGVEFHFFDNQQLGFLIAADWAYFKTTDGGENWELLYKEFPDFSPNLPITAIAIDSSKRLTFGNYVSTDKGETWEEKIDGLDHFEINDIAVMPDGSVFLATGHGGVYRSGSTYTDITEDSEQSARDFIKIFPSPADDILNISFSLPESSKVSITLTDVLGNVFPIMEEFLYDGRQHKISVNSDKYTPGLYVLMVQTGVDVYTKNLIIEH